MTEKAAIVKLDSDGAVVQCAKGLESAECGYAPGAKVCGKCGAMAVSVKMADDTEMDAAMIGKKKKKKQMTAGVAMDADLDEEMMPEDDEDTEDMEDMELVDVEEDEDEDDEDDEMMDGEEDKMYGASMMPKRKKKMYGATQTMMASDDEDDMDEDVAEKMYTDDDEIDEMMQRRTSPKKKKKMMADAASMDSEEEEYDDESSVRAKMRRRRLSTMGYKSADFDDNAFICGFDRKVYTGGAGVCDSCPGGCVSEKGMPSLIEIEGMAEDMFRGKVLDSGYSDEADLFIVDVERKDGKPVEVFFDGSTGEVMGWHMLTQDVMQSKSAFGNKVLISFGDAADIAVKSVEGDIIAVEPDVFEGFDVYAVEIEGVNGKSYDVFVSLDGEVLGFDEYTQEEATEIESEAAEIALKRAYSEDARENMSKVGQALPDGSFPIKDESDLRNAVQAFGRAKDKSAAKNHIMKRAVDLGFEELIPMSWVSKEDMEKSAQNIDSDNLEKSEESNFMGSLLEFEMLSIEQDINLTKPE